MPVFKIKDVEKCYNVCIYEVQAETAEEALELYCNELAGSLEPVNDYYESDEKEDVTVID